MSLPGDPPPRGTVRGEDALVRALSERSWVVVCDGARRLGTKAFGFFRGLWDAPATRLGPSSSGPGPITPKSAPVRLAGTVERVALSRFRW
jgi:hypothetical protein